MNVVPISVEHEARPRAIPKDVQEAWKDTMKYIKQYTKEIQKSYSKIGRNYTKIDKNYKNLEKPMSDQALEKQIYSIAEITPSLMMQTAIFERIDEWRKNARKGGPGSFMYSIPNNKQLYKYLLQLLLRDIDIIREWQQEYLRFKATYNNISEDTINNHLISEIDRIVKNDNRKLPVDDEKRKRLIRFELRNFLLQNPQTMSWDEIYAIAEERVGNNKRAILNNDELRRIIESGRSPWRMKDKVYDFGSRMDWNVKQINDYIDDRNNHDTFNMKEQRKLMKHWVAPRYTYVLDYVYFGRFMYMFAINVNTRKLYFVLPDEIKQYGTGWIKDDDKKPKASAKSAVNSLKQLMEMTTVKHLMMDNENAWTSKMYRDYCDKHDITYRYEAKYDVRALLDTNKKERRSTHTVTSLVDRVIRTIRQMNYNLGNRNEINPNVLEYLINEYNSSPHTTLSRLLKYNVSPNDVDNDVELETEIVKLLRIENLRIETNNDKSLQPMFEDVDLRVYNNAHSFDKVKPKLLPGKWKFVERENGMYKLRQNNTEIMVPRWMIKNDYS